MVILGLKGCGFVRLLAVEFGRGVFCGSGWLPGPTPPPETVAWCGVCGSEWLGDFIDAEITEVYGATYYCAV